MKKIGVLLILTSTVLCGYNNIKPHFLSHPTQWPKPRYDVTMNPISTVKLALGRRLFYDPILSRDSTISCASCHLQYSCFTHIDHRLSHGIDGRIGTRNSPVLVNLAWSNSFMWDGAVNHLDAQALAPITNVLEMDNNIGNVVKKLNANSQYRKLFLAAWNDSIPTGEHTLKSIGAFLATIVSCHSKYDSVKEGRSVFTVKEQKGYQLFQKHCNHCHTEPLFTNNAFENNGLPADTVLNDIGRVKISQKVEDSFKFKVPTLRNIEFSSPYMHDGRFRTLSQVMNHYSSGIVAGKTLNKRLQNRLQLSANEKVELIAFLLTLSDKSFLSDPTFGYPGVGYQ